MSRPFPRIPVNNLQKIFIREDRYLLSQQIFRIKAHTGLRSLFQGPNARCVNQAHVKVGALEKGAEHL
jgi:hypothetical protein